MKTRVAVATLVIPFIAACGGSNKAVNTSKSPSGASSGSSTVSSAPSSAPSGTTLDKSFWHSGFKVTVADVAVVKPPPPSPGYPVGKTKLLMNATFENLGPDNATPYNLEMVIQSGTSSYLDHDSEDEKIPEVPGLQKTKGMIAFFVDDKFNLRNAVLLAGSAANNQAQVPLGGSGKSVSLEPQKVAVSGTITLPNAYTAAVSGGVLTYDDPKDHRSEKAGDVLLTVTFALTGLRDSTCCLTGENLILKLPDGTAVASHRNSTIEIPGKGLTTPNETAQWVFKGADGAYSMIMKGKYGPENAEEQADLPFSLTLGVSASASGSPAAGGAYPSPSSSSSVPQASPSGH